MTRPFPTDRPRRDPFGQKGVIRARINATNYIVDFGGSDGTAQLAFSRQVFNVGDTIRAVWADESGIWLIRTFGFESFEVAYPYDKLGASLNGPHLQGLAFDMISTGGAPPRFLPTLTYDFANVPGELTTPGGTVGTVVQALRWHPSGNYIAVQYADAASPHANYIAVYAVGDRTWGSRVAVTAQATQGLLPYVSIDWTPDGNYIATTEYNGTSVTTIYVRVYAVNFGGGALALAASATEGVIAVVGSRSAMANCSPHGTYIAYGHGDALFQVTYGRLYTWAAPTTLTKVGDLVAAQTADIGFNAAFPPGNDYVFVVNRAAAKAFPITPSTIGTPLTMPAPAAALGARYGFGSMIEVHPDGVHVLTQHADNQWNGPTVAEWLGTAWGSSTWASDNPLNGHSAFWVIRGSHALILSWTELIKAFHRWDLAAAAPLHYLVHDGANGGLGLQSGPASLRPRP